MADGIQDDARGRSRAAGREQAAAFVWRILGVRPPMKEMETQSKLSLKLQAYQYLKTKILNCEYRPNEFLNE